MSEISPALRADMVGKKIDVDLTLSILGDYNSGLYDSVRPIAATGVPTIDGVRVIDLRDRVVYSIDAGEARERLAELGVEPVEGLPTSGFATFDRDGLAALGERLLGRTAFGVLNGGSATSYADRKKNLAFGAAEFAALEPAFDALAPSCLDRPKGLTPAYLNPDGSPGASFLALKMRSRLIAAARSAASGAIGAGGAIGADFLPLFQMTSVGNDEELAAAYRELAADPFLAPLAERVGLEPAAWSTGVQPMIAAYTHSGEGRPKRVFDRARGEADSALALPGGHGQSFRVLAPVFRALRDRGVRFAYLGNVDNVGYLPDPVEIAILALSGKPAAFDFALRTPMDVKGGILVETEDAGPGGAGRAVAELGMAIRSEDVKSMEAAGSVFLFNCATGLFDLDWLVPRIEELGRRLPVRFTDQDKDAGRYSQAEQNTWEIARLLPDFLAFAVNKYDRFLAAKLLVETLLTSGVAAGDPRIGDALADTARRLHAGLRAKLSGAYGLELRAGRWVPTESERRWSNAQDVQD